MKKTLISMLALLTFIAHPVVFAAATDQGTINIIATVEAECEVYAPPAVDLGVIPTSIFVDKKNGALLNDYAKTFTLSSSCYGNDNVEFVFSAGNSVGKCIGTDKAFMGFCLNIASHELDFTNGKASYNGGEENIPVTVTPQVMDVSAGVAAGNIIGTINIIIRFI